MTSLADIIFPHTFVRENPFRDLFLSSIFTQADKIHPGVYKACVCKHPQIVFHFTYHIDKGCVSWACPL